MTDFTSRLKMRFMLASLVALLLGTAPLMAVEANMQVSRRQGYVGSL